MARIRTIKPEFPQSESMGRVSRDARLLFVLLWTIADDHGRARAHSRMLASLLFPYDDDAGKLLPKWLQELENEGCIRLYEVRGSQYLEIKQWDKHQRIDKPSKPQFPDPSEDTREDSRESRERSSEEGKGREGSRRERDIDHRADDRSRLESDFDTRFWPAYPHKVGKAKALAAWLKAAPDAETVTAIEAALAVQRTWPQWTRDGGEFIPHPATWLNGKRWEDEPPTALPAAALTDRQHFDFVGAI